MKKVIWSKFNKITKPYLNQPNDKVGHFSKPNKDSIIIISAPHGVSQNRLGKLKVAEIGSAKFALELNSRLNANLIIKTKNMFDDANFEENCAYRKEIDKMLLNNPKIKYLFDFHGLAQNRDCDINLGVNLGYNIKYDVEFYEKLLKDLLDANFKVSIDQPFSAKSKTIAGCFANKYNIFSIQVEINCSITNLTYNHEKLNLLIYIFEKNLTALNKGQL